MPRRAFVLVTAVYVKDLPPLFNWAHSILAALIVLTVLQNCCLPFVHNRLYLLALALFILCVLVNIMSVQSYSTALIWVCPQCTLIFFYQAFMSLNSRTWFAIWFSAEFGYSSPLCVRSLATLNPTLCLSPQQTSAPLRIALGHAMQGFQRHSYRRNGLI